MKRLILASVFVLLGCALAHADTCTAALMTGIYPCSVDVTWTSTTTGETEFDVEKRVNGGPWNFVGKTAAKVTIFTDNLLWRSITEDNIYCYQVRAATLSSASPPSAQNPSTCITIPKPVVPQSGIVITFKLGTGELTVGDGKRRFQFNGQDGQLILNSSDILLDTSNIR